VLVRRAFFLVHSTNDILPHITEQVPTQLGRHRLFSSTFTRLQYRCCLQDRISNPHPGLLHLYHRLAHLHCACCWLRFRALLPDRHLILLVSNLFHVYRYTTSQ
ncbi:hypothetical protein HETIRDRAFT_437565, partial [Heterobasidion irregulare TC 32-1]